MFIRSQRLAVELDGDVAHVTLSWELIIQDNEFADWLGYIEWVGLPPVFKSEEFQVQKSWFYKPSRNATWMQYDDGITYTVARPKGRRPLLVHGTIHVEPMIKFGDARSTNEGVIPPNTAVLPIVAALVNWLSNLASKLRGR
jgi:hypothetical protein